MNAIAADSFLCWIDSGGLRIEWSTSDIRLSFTVGRSQLSPPSP